MVAGGAVVGVPVVAVVGAGLAAVLCCVVVDGVSGEPPMGADAVVLRPRSTSIPPWTRAAVATALSPAAWTTDVD